MLAVTLAFLTQVGVAAASCSYDSVAALRDADVASGFDPAKMRGLWYEHGYKDPAQVGASCQTLNASLDSTTGILKTDFSVKYGFAPFTIVEIYEPFDGKTDLATGVFRKSVEAPFNMPGGHLVGLHTAVVKAELAADTSRYETIVLYSCVPIVGVEEVVIATRKTSITDDDFGRLMDSIKAKGLPSNGVKRVDRSSCDKAATTVLV